jgi:formamidopyrimidine-DNA glycosylase
MFELPEYVVLASQITETLNKKQIESASLGNSPHKFVWYNITHDEFSRIMAGKTFGPAYSRGRWMFIPVNPGYVLVFGECGGKILYHKSAATIPEKYHLLVRFVDGGALSAMTQMWGAMALYKNGEERKQIKYIREMKATPLDKEFTLEYFNDLIDHCLTADTKTAKGLLTQKQLIPGLGNSIAQDILFAARMSPKHPVKELASKERKVLFNAITKTVQDIIAKRGRHDEFDLFGEPGGYKRKMDKNSVGKPCPRCGGTVLKIQFLGGACYFCPGCQN